jgi:hypothetical protein
VVTWLQDAIYRTSYEGVFQVKKQARDDMKWSSRPPLHCYLERNGIICETLAQYNEAQPQLDKEEEGKNKNEVITFSR